MGLTRILRSSVGMKEQIRSGTPSEQCHMESRLDQGLVLGDHHGPPDHAPRIEIKHYRQIEPPFICPDRGNISSPFLIGTRSGELTSEQIGGYRCSRLTVRGSGPMVRTASTQSSRSHQAGYPFP
jgi:hypothetical protein